MTCSLEGDEAEEEVEDDTEREGIENIEGTGNVLVHVPLDISSVSRALERRDRETRVALRHLNALLERVQS